MKQISRRGTLAGVATLVVARAVANPHVDDNQQSFSSLERRSGGRLGVCVLDTESGRVIGHRVNERFAMCSTFKLLLVGAILSQVGQRKLDLQAIVPYTKADMVSFAPVTEKNLRHGGMTIAELAEAAQKQSDNVAANLLLKLVGGPPGFTQFLRRLGDTVTQLDRFEPEMNDVQPGDNRDTTTPAAMAATVAALLTGNILTPSLRERLAEWMIATQTGRKRIRAGLPADWRAGDKTGTYLGRDGSKLNDVAIVYPPNRAPAIIAAYYNTTSPAETIRDEDQAILAQAGGIAANILIIGG